MVYIYENVPELSETYFGYLQSMKAEGKKLLSYFSHEFIPQEILRALNIIPVPLIWAGDDTRVSIGSDYLTPTMCPFALSQIGAFQIKEENPRFRFLTLLDGILATNYCAADMVVNEWIRDLNNLKWFTLHIPFLQEEHHIQYYRSELIRLVKELESFSGIKLDPIKAQKEILNSNAMRLELQKILSSSLLGSQKNKIIQQFQLFGSEGLSDWNLSALTSFQHISSDIPPQKLNNLLLAGSSVFIGDDLYAFIEECGGNVVVDATWLGLASLPKDIQRISSEIECNSVDAIFDYFTECFKSNCSSLHCAPQSTSQYINLLQSKAREAGVNAIIYHILKFCDITGHHRVDIKNGLIKDGFQCLTLERDYSASMSGQIRTRIEAFFEML